MASAATQRPDKTANVALFMSLSSRNGLTLGAKLSTDGLEPFAPSSNYLNNRGAANKKGCFWSAIADKAIPMKRFL